MCNIIAKIFTEPQLEGDASGGVPREGDNNNRAAAWGSIISVPCEKLNH